MKSLLGKEYAAHDALSDVIALQELYQKKLQLTQSEMGKQVVDLLASHHKTSLEPGSVREAKSDQQLKDL